MVRLGQCVVSMMLLDNDAGHIVVTDVAGRRCRMMSAVMANSLHQQPNLEGQ